MTSDSEFMSFNDVSRYYNDYIAYGEYGDEWLATERERINRIHAHNKRVIDTTMILGMAVAFIGFILALTVNFWFVLLMPASLLLWPFESRWRKDYDEGETKLMSYEEWKAQRDRKNEEQTQVLSDILPAETVLNVEEAK